MWMTRPGWTMSQCRFSRVRRPWRISAALLSIPQTWTRSTRCISIWYAPPILSFEYRSLEDGSSWTENILGTDVVFRYEIADGVCHIVGVSDDGGIYEKIDFNMTDGTFSFLQAVVIDNGGADAGNLQIMVSDGKDIKVDEDGGFHGEVGFITCHYDDYSIGDRVQPAYISVGDGELYRGGDVVGFASHYNKMYSSETSTEAGLLLESDFSHDYRDAGMLISFRNENYTQPDKPYCGVVWYGSDGFKKAPEPSGDDPVSFYSFGSVEEAQCHIEKYISADWKLMI